MSETAALWSPPAGTAALIFDCDGTLADTMPAHRLAWLAMLEPHGIPFTEQRFYELGGMPSEAIIPLLASEAGTTVGDIGAMVVDKESRYLDTIAAVQAVEAVVAIAERHRGVLPMAVASGGERYVVEKTLAVLGISDWFDALVGAEDTERHKPEPDPFLEAARRLGAEPSRCVVFEDTSFGLEAARRAGMFGVDVRPWYSRSTTTGA